MPRITLVGFYRWSDEQLFDGMVLPDTISKPIFIRLLLKNYGALFPWQQDGDELILDINSWFESRLPYYTRLSDAILADYNPIENYRRNEEHERAGNSKISKMGSDTRTEKNTENAEGADSKTTDTTSSLKGKTVSGKKDDHLRTLAADTSATTEGTGNVSRESQTSTSGSETASVAAYNSENFTNREKTDRIATGSENSTEANSTSGTEKKDENVTETIGVTSDTNATDEQEGSGHGTEVGTISRTNIIDTQMDGTSTSEQTEKTDGTEKIVAYGNVGVTTTQKMIREEIALREMMNSLYVIVMKEFEAEFLMRVY